MRKRVRFIISSILLSLGLLTTQFVPLEVRPFAIVLFFLASYCMSAWALSTTINGIEWLTIVPYPSMYALSVAFFYFLLPSNILSRIAIITLFGVGMYALYLSSNIFAFGKIKTIQLLRAAHAVSSLFLFLLCLFLYNFIFSLRLHPLLNMVAVLLATFVPVLCATWSIELDQRISKKVAYISIFFSILIAEVALALSFLPLGLWTSSLYLTALVYVGFGIIQNYLVGRLFARTLREYIWLAGFVTLALLFLIKWK
ncbi:MAG: hypothetical protein ABI758_06565 [Candidatus Woesebacteria bacterium]